MRAIAYAHERIEVETAAFKRLRARVCALATARSRLRVRARVCYVCALRACLVLCAGFVCACAFRLCALVCVRACACSPCSPCSSVRARFVFARLCALRARVIE